ncbi:MAG TPA: hypothetical protein VOA88_11065 [Candidatus Dormibacteraeota bacterium]|nr:hypothetical protein [Candidatus Dormibacteraeota bacterium]
MREFRKIHTTISELEYLIGRLIFAAAAIKGIYVMLFTHAKP